MKPIIKTVMVQGHSPLALVYDNGFSSIVLVTGDENNGISSTTFKMAGTEKIREITQVMNEFCDNVETLLKGK